MSCCRCRERKRFRSLDSAHACTHAAQVNCFVVRKGARGLRTAKIENKIALRSVQNADIFLDDCFVPDTARLPGVSSFRVRLDVACTSAFNRCLFS